MEKEERTAGRVRERERGGWERRAVSCVVSKEKGEREREREGSH